ncbi:PREDICTED: protein SRC2 homolog [Tarenaya hassleriana]|uniref:protein SRC2 homolog n=1 Tax=Tarenaya hassleriana TaxID=28532 RepID=UPI00053C47C7|nr:PREDICTED: protein SRC2 homolog [Tarenaya hassleriana]
MCVYLYVCSIETFISHKSLRKIEFYHRPRNQNRFFFRPFSGISKFQSEEATDRTNKIMEYRPLDLTIISAKDLKDIQLIGKQDVYAVVSINGDARTKQKTPVDKDCGTKPKWKHHVKLTVDDAAARENRLNLVFQIVAYRPIAGDKIIGEVTVPVRELLEYNSKSGDGEKKLTYAVRLPSGKTKGSLKFSYKFGEKFTYVPNGPGVAGPGSSTVAHKTMDQPVMAYPPGHGPYPPPTAGPSGYAPPSHGPKPGSGYAYPHHGYPPPPPQHGYPGYPPAPGYGYPGYPAPGPYGYPQQVVQGKPQKPKKHGSSGLGLGLGLGAGLLGGLLVGEAISDVADTVDACDDMDGGFDF